MSQDLLLVLFPVLALLSGYLGARGVPGILIGIVGAFAAAAFTYSEMPTLAWDFTGLPAMLLLCGLTGVVAYGLRSMTSHSEDNPGIPLPGVALLGVSLTWFVAQGILSLGFVNPEGYRNVISVTERKMDGSVELIDQTHARLVDEGLARRRALELLGVDKGLGSTFGIGKPAVQMVAGKQVWVAALEPASFGAWFGGAVSPGYVVVSATNYSDARIELNHPLKTSKGMWFWDNVERIAYKAAPGRGQTGHEFEIDDEGRPFFVVSLYRHTVGADAPVVDGVMLVNATTGESKTYAVADVPAWVDRVQPEWMVDDQLGYWGDYVKGWWNPGKVDIVHPTSTMSLVTLADGKSAWFTGIVNARSESQNSSATNGFALVDARTGLATIYYGQGISESAAKAALEGIVQEKRYGAVNPIAYKVHGALTYVAILKDAAGNPRLIGMVSALDRSVAATGETIEDVTRLYASRLRHASERVSNLGVEAAPSEVGGTLVRSGSYVLDGHGYQLVRLDVDGAQRDYSVDLGIPALREVVLARVGDRVDLKVTTSGDGITEVRSVKVVAVDVPPMRTNAVPNR